MKKIETILLIILFSLSLFTHFYKLTEHFNLTDDPGRDAVTVRDIIVHQKLTLLGPKTSIGGFYYGPLYFYLLVPFFFLTRLDPVAAPILSSIIGVITVLVVYYLSRELFGRKTAFFSSFLYTSSPFVLDQARKGWNPSLLPLFTSLCFYLFYKFLKEKNIKYLIFWGISLGMAFQFHFAIVFSLPVYLFLFFYQGIKIKSSLKGLILAITATMFFFLPIVLFEVRHDFITSKSFLDFLSFGVEKGKIYHPSMSLTYYSKLIYDSLTALIFTGRFKNYFLIIFSLLSAAVIFTENRKLKTDNAFIYLLILFFSSLFVLGFYKGPVHPYYWIFILPLPFIIGGWLLGRLGEILSIILFFLIFWENFKLAPFWREPKRTMMEEKEAAKIISKDARSLGYEIPINIVMFSDLNAIHSAFEYRYLIQYYGKEVLPAEDYRSAEKLYIVAEQKIDNPINQPVMEIRDFKPRTVEREWKTGAGYTIYRLGK